MLRVVEECPEMIFDDEVLCVGYFNLLEDAVLVFADQERRDVLLKSQFWCSCERHGRWVTPAPTSGDQSPTVQRLVLHLGNARMPREVRQDRRYSPNASRFDH